MNTQQRRELRQSAVNRLIRRRAAGRLAAELGGYAISYVVSGNERAAGYYARNAATVAKEVRS